MPHHYVRANAQKLPLHATPFLSPLSVSLRQFNLFIPSNPPSFFCSSAAFCQSLSRLTLSCTASEVLLCAVPAQTTHPMRVVRTGRFFHFDCTPVLDHRSHRVHMFVMDRANAPYCRGPVSATLTEELDHLCPRVH